MRLSAARSRHRLSIIGLPGSAPCRGMTVVLARLSCDEPTTFSQLLATEEVT